MKNGYSTETRSFFIDDNCIIVSNYYGLNKIVNYPWDMANYERGDDNDIGI